MKASKHGDFAVIMYGMWLDICVSRNIFSSFTQISNANSKKKKQPGMIIKSKLYVNNRLTSDV